jgi:release factor glutamine methyltransferase
MSVNNVVADTVQQVLHQSATPVPRREAQLLLAHVLGKTREWVMAYPEAEITTEQREQFEALIAQAKRGVPLPYLLRHWEFFGLDFIVTPDVLIPRPETELLVERALSSIKRQTSGTARDQHANVKILDVGTGSGIIAVTLAAKLPEASVTAVDISTAALNIAKQNAEKHGVAERVEFIESDLLSSIESGKTFDLICANLPYIPSTDVNTLEVANHEPKLALDGGEDGLALISRLLTNAPHVLAHGGTILLEIEYRQGEAVKTFAQTIFPNATVTVHKDLAGLDRVIEINHE